MTALHIRQSYVTFMSSITQSLNFFLGLPVGSRPPTLTFLHLTQHPPCPFHMSKLPLSSLPQLLKKKAATKGVRLAWWSSVAPPTSTTQDRVRMWAEIYRSQSDSEGFSLGTPVFLPLQI